METTNYLLIGLKKDQYPSLPEVSEAEGVKYPYNYERSGENIDAVMLKACIHYNSVVNITIDVYEKKYNDEGMPHLKYKTIAEKNLKYNHLIENHASHREIGILKKKSQILVYDESGKTPKQLAIINIKPTIEQMLESIAV